MKTICLLFCYALLSLLGVQAQIIHVPADQPTIQSGINASNNGDTVLVAEGTYLENIIFKGKAITVASHFIMDGDTSHISNTVINGSQPSHPDSASVVMFVNGEDTTSILCGFTITGGNGMYWNYWDNIGGGGIACSRAGARIVHNRITGNTAVDPSFAFGGGIACDTDSGENWVIIENNEVKNNSVITNTGIASSGGIYVGFNARIRNNIIEANSCICPDGHADAGGIRWDSEPVGLKSVLFDNNVVRNNMVQGGEAWGGGVMVYKSSSVITHNSITGNQVTAHYQARGAGIFLLENQGEILILDNTISGNALVSELFEAYGGGLSLWYANLLKNNCALHGGGLFFHEAYHVEFTNNIFINDTAYAYGGAVCCGYPPDNTLIPFTGFLNLNTDSAPEYRSGKDDHPVFMNNTFMGNQASTGGALFSNYSESYPVIINSLFWDNQALEANDLYILESPNLPVYHCNIDTANIIGTWNGEGNIFENPLFCDNMCHISWWDSPCWNAGTGQVEIDGVIYIAPDHDFEGTPRPGDVYVDIGADEDLMGVGMEELQAASCRLQVFPNPSSGISEIKYQIAKIKDQSAVSSRQSVRTLELLCMI